MYYRGRNLPPVLARRFRHEDEYDESVAEANRRDTEQRLIACTAYSICRRLDRPREHYWVAWRTGQSWRAGAEPDWRGTAHSREAAEHSVRQVIGWFGYTTELNPSVAAGRMPR